MQTRPPATDRLPTGLPGFDEILGGGFERDRSYLVEGKPGTGKTTLALQFLLEGVRRGERGLYITLSETRDELNAVAASHGWDLGDLQLFELVPAEANLDPGHVQTLIHPSEVELGETTRAIFDVIDAQKPTRVVFDSLSEMRLLAQNSLRYRRQILALKQFFAGRHITVMLLDDLSSEPNDLQLHSIAHGVVRLGQLPAEYGSERRRLRVVKMRGVAYQGGYHDFTIETGGIIVYPRLQAGTRGDQADGEPLSSGVAELDQLVGGGLDRGTSTLIIGPSGVGKSTLALCYALSAVAQGEKAVLYAFDEGIATLLKRARGLGMPLDQHIAAGRIRIEAINPAELSPGEFVALVRRDVEGEGCCCVVIDTLNGYLNAMPEEKFLLLQMHELLSYLSQQGVVTMLVLAQHGLLGSMHTPLDVSYLSDTVLLLRYFESGGAVHQALSVMKRRSGPHERTIREYRLDASGIRVGPPLTGFQGVLSGIPSLVETDQPLLQPKE